MLNSIFVRIKGSNSKWKRFIIENDAISITGYPYSTTLEYDTGNGVIGELITKSDPSIPVMVEMPIFTNTTPHMAEYTLTVSTGEWTVNPVSYSYVWLRDGVVIENQTQNEYLLTNDDVGSIIGVTVSATSEHDETGNVTIYSEEIQPNSNIISVSIDGNTHIGSILTANVVAIGEYDIMWKVDNINTGITTDTFDTSGLSDNDSVTVEVSNFELETMSSSSVIMIAPDLSATKSTTTLKENESIVYTFNEIPDSISATLNGTPIIVTGNDLEYTITPNESGSLIVNASKLNYTSYTDTIEVVEALDIGLSVDNTKSTTAIDGTGNVTFNITEPSEFAGSYSVDLFTENEGNPLNIDYMNNIAPQLLKKPEIYRYAGPGTVENNYPSTEYHFNEGLIGVKHGSDINISYMWYEDGIETGYTGNTYSRVGEGMVYVNMVVSVESQEIRTTNSNMIEGEIKQTDSTFEGAASGTYLGSISDSSGRIWTASPAPNTIIQNVILSNNEPDTLVKGTYSLNGVYGALTDFDNDVNEVFADIYMPAASAYTGSEFAGLLLHAEYTDGDKLSGMAGYYAVIRLRDGYIYFGKKNIGGQGQTYQNGFHNAAYSPALGKKITLKLKSEGDNILLYIDDILIKTQLDTTYRNGGGGLAFWSNTNSANLSVPYGLTKYGSRTN